MKTLHSLSLVAALGLASTVYAQAPTNPPGPTASSMTGTQAAKLVGAKVEMPNGEALGEVKDVVVDKQGNASYAVALMAWSWDSVANGPRCRGPQCRPQCRTTS